MDGEILENLQSYPITITLPRAGDVNRISLEDFDRSGGKRGTEKSVKCSK